MPKASLQKIWKIRCRKGAGTKMHKYLVGLYILIKSSIHLYVCMYASTTISVCFDYLYKTQSKRNSKIISILKILTNSTLVISNF